jgi:hypothetical protein
MQQALQAQNMLLSHIVPAALAETSQQPELQHSSSFHLVLR